MKFSYNADFSHLAPFMPIRLINITTAERQLELSAQLDTGADMSAIPQSVVADLSLRAKDRITVADFEKRQLVVEVYTARIELPNGRGGMIDVIGAADDYVLLGRDVLNQLRLLLDGPAQSLEILD